MLFPKLNGVRGVSAANLWHGHEIGEYNRANSNKITLIDGGGWSKWCKHPTEIHANRFARQWQFGGLGQWFTRQMIHIHAEQWHQFTVDLIWFLLDFFQMIELIPFIEFVHEWSWCGLVNWIVAILDGQCVGGRCFHVACGAFDGTTKIGILGTIAQFKDPAQTALTHEFVFCNDEEKDVWLWL